LSVSWAGEEGRDEGAGLVLACDLLVVYMHSSIWEGYTTITLKMWPWLWSGKSRNACELFSAAIQAIWPSNHRALRSDAEMIPFC